MTWSDEVHNNRLQAAISRATAERKLRKRGLPVPIMETAQVGPVMAMAALASGLAVWQRFGGKFTAALAQNPLVQQFRTLIFGNSSQTSRPLANKGGGSTSAGGKLTARKPAVSPQEAAAAAAEARVAASLASTSQTSASRLVPPIPTRPAETGPQPQASTSAATPSVSSQDATQARGGAGGSGGSKKKKGGKKRR